VTEVVLDIQALPEMVFSKIPSRKVKIYEKNGTITLTPIFEERPCFNHLVGKFSDGRVSVDDFLDNKQREKELEI